jgi:hypothetical protein
MTSNKRPREQSHNSDDDLPSSKLPTPTPSSEQFDDEELLSGTIRSLSDFLTSKVLVPRIEVPMNCIVGGSNFRPINDKGMENIRNSFIEHPNLQSTPGYEVLVRLADECT